MNRTIVCLFLVAVFAVPLTAQAQHSGHHAGGYSFGFGGFGGYPMGYGGNPGYGQNGGFNGNTIGGMYAGAGQFLEGMAALTQAAGQYEESVSRTAVTYQQVYSMQIDNRVKKEQAHFQMRRDNASYRSEVAAERPHAAPEQLAAFSRARVPNPLTLAQWNPGEGLFGWPRSLAGDDDFAADRGQIEAMFVARDTDTDQHLAGHGSENYRQILRQITTLEDHLHAKIKTMSADDYIAARKFLKSLEYTARYAPSPRDA